MTPEFEALLERANRVGAVPTKAVAEDDTIYEVRTQDVEPLLRKLDDMRIDGAEGYTDDRELLYVGEIPVVLVERWCTEHGVNPARMLQDGDCDMVQRMLNDFSAFKLFRGRW